MPVAASQAVLCRSGFDVMQQLQSAHNIEQEGLPRRSRVRDPGKMFTIIMSKTGKPSPYSRGVSIPASVNWNLEIQRKYHSSIN